jgi:exodeoxyribonuclease VII large subunit
MLEILGRRWPLAEVWVCAVRVQGDGAGAEIAAALQLLNRLDGVDVIIVGRGGGSAEDLWAFNEEGVAQAIYHSRIPVVSAVGHEIDLTIADMVADCRALTPSEAAEKVTPNHPEMLDGLHNINAQIRELLMRRLEFAKGRLGDLVERRAFRFPLERIHDGERRVDDWAERLQRTIQNQLQRKSEHLSGQAARLEAVSPLNVLGRGYSLTRSEKDQSVVRSSDQVQPGDRVITRLHQGYLVSRVEETAPAVS